jgi:pSer/pThr/pTyr-binding forkhead associated (FHA) protein
MTPTQASSGQATLAALTPEAKDAIGGAELPITRFPFRVGRDSRGARRAVARIIMDRRRPVSRPNNELYLPEPEQATNVSREHFQIEHNGAQYVLVDRQSTCGTLVEGQMVGGKQAGGAVPLRDGDVIIVGTSASRFVFKFRAG